jgi:hypothetical protein
VGLIGKADRIEKQTRYHDGQDGQERVLGEERIRKIIFFTNNIFL